MPRYRVRVEAILDEEDEDLLRAAKLVSEKVPAFGARVALMVMDRQVVSAQIVFQEVPE